MTVTMVYGVLLGRVSSEKVFGMRGLWDGGRAGVTVGAGDTYLLIIK